MAKPNLRTSVAGEIKASFREAAIKQGLPESRLLQLLVTTFLQHNPRTENHPVAISYTKDDRFSFRLSGKLKNDLGSRAQEQCMTPGSYLVTLVRAHLSNEPAFTAKELEVLHRSNYELAALGRNINQIARALNSSLDNAHLARASELEQVGELIKSHRDYVRYLIKSNQTAWGVGHDQLD